MNQREIVEGLAGAALEVRKAQEALGVLVVSLREVARDIDRIQAALLGAPAPPDVFPKTPEEDFAPF